MQASNPPAAPARIRPPHPPPATTAPTATVTPITPSTSSSTSRSSNSSPVPSEDSGAPMPGAKRSSRRRVSLPTDQIALVPWPDPLLDRVGHDPRSDYVERFWLPVLGPSALVLLRCLVGTFEDPAALGASARTDDIASPRITDVERIAEALGMGSPSGPSASFFRTLERVMSFGFAHLVDGSTLAVRTHLPALTRRQLGRLSDRLRDDHDRWLAERSSPPGVATEQVVRRARALALSLLDLGEDRADAERQLHRWQFHPAIAHQAMRWAVVEHERRRRPASPADDELPWPA